MPDYIVSAGQTLSGIIVQGTAAYGGTVAPSTVEIRSEGTLADSSFAAGGVGTVEGGGTATMTTVSGGSLIVSSGGSATATLVNGVFRAQGQFYYPLEAGFEVQASGQATNTTITAGSAQIDVGGIASGVLVDITPSSNSGLPGLWVYGTASAVAVQQGVASIAGGGLLDDATVTGGGTLAISAGGSLVAVSAINDGGLIANSGNVSVLGQTGSYNLRGPNNGSILTVGSGGAFSNAGSVSINGGVGGGALYSPTSGGTLVADSGASITNTGTIAANGGSGGKDGGNGAGGGLLLLSAGATLTNQGQVSLDPGNVGYIGPLGGGGTLTVASDATFINAGTLAIASSFSTPAPFPVTGGAGLASVAGTLVLDPGQVTNGIVQGSSGAVLELASGGNATLSGLGSTYAGFSTVQVDPNANITFTGTDALDSGATLQLGSASTVTDGVLTSAGPSTMNFQGASTFVENEGLNNVTFTGFNTADLIDLIGLAPAVYQLSGSGNRVEVSNPFNPAFASDIVLSFAGESGRHYALTSLAGTIPNSYAVTLEPVVTAIAAHTDRVGPLAAGDVVTFDLTAETPMTVNTTTGLPTLSLDDGGVAAYDQAASTATNLVFRTTIAGGQNSTDLTVTGLSLAGATAVDALGTTLDVSSVATLSGVSTGIVVAAAPTTAPMPPTVTGGVTVLAGAGGTVFITPVAGSNSVIATATGNDTVISQGKDTIQAGGGADLVYATGPAATVAGGTGSLTFEGGSGSYMAVGGSGANALYGGTGIDLFFGGRGSNLLVASSGAGDVLVAGLGNSTLIGGLGKGVMMFGGPGANSFTGSSSGGDIMVGGTGSNSFSLTNGDVAFGGPIRQDSFTARNGTTMITTGNGGAQVNLGSGTLTSFEGSGTVNYNAGKGEGGTTDIVGFTVHDHITLTGGFTATDASAAFSKATKGGFGTTLNLIDGTKITVFGVDLTASQISVG